jgi:glucose-1-phosphate adenylyltransferase
MKDCVVMILAGGKGDRIYPLSRDRAKPAIPFGGKYRIIDFVLNNFINSGFYQIHVVTQFKSQSLNRHIMQGWRMSSQLDHYVTLVPAQMRMGNKWYTGTADSIYQNIGLVEDYNPDTKYLMVFGGDHIYKMDVSQFLESHIQKKADLSICAIPVPVSQASQFGVIVVDENWRITGFQEKPKENPATIPGNPGYVLASMGNYIFTKNIIVDELKAYNEEERVECDFGKHIIPKLVKTHAVYAYDFSKNTHAGITPSEMGYWRDVGTIESYWEANMDLVAVTPQLNLYNPQWPLRTNDPIRPPAKFIFDSVCDGRTGHALNSIVSDGCIISGGTIHRSVLSPNVRVNSFSFVQESVLMEGVQIGRNCRIRKAIIDKCVTIPDGTVIGFDIEADRKRFAVSETGIVVIPRNEQVQSTCAA